MPPDVKVQRVKSLLVKPSFTHVGTTNSRTGPYKSIIETLVTHKKITTLTGNARKLLKKSTNPSSSCNKDS